MLIIDYYYFIFEHLFYWEFSKITVETKPKKMSEKTDLRPYKFKLPESAIPTDLIHEFLQKNGLSEMDLIKSLSFENQF